MDKILKAYLRVCLSLAQTSAVDLSTQLIKEKSLTKQAGP